MSKLFDQTQIKTLLLKNRFVRSATWEGMAEEDGSCTSKLTDLMVNLAKGGVGLIITGHSYVHRTGQASPRQLGINNDGHISKLSAMVDSVHKEGGKIVMQIAHAGCQTNADLTGSEPMGPSVFKVDEKPVCREMTQAEISEAIVAFGEAAQRVQKAGFDGVQIHSAHGYLLSEFLSPFYNKREDAYGGPLENRARIVLDSYRSIRRTVGDDFPVLVKINSEDFLESGLSMQEMIEVCSMLEKEGIDAIEISGGTINSDKKKIPVRPGILESEDKEAFYRHAAQQFKAKLNSPLILVGGIRSFSVSEELVNKGITDYVSMSRPFIREPDLVNRWKSGDHSKSSCKSDNACFRPAMKGEGIYCVTKKREKDAKN